MANNPHDYDQRSRSHGIFHPSPAAATDHFVDAAYSSSFSTCCTKAECNRCLKFLKNSTRKLRHRWISGGFAHFGQPGYVICCFCHSVHACVACDRNLRRANPNVCSLEICKMAIADSSMLKCHEAYTHSSQKLFRCRICRRLFKEKRGARRVHKDKVGEKSLVMSAKVEFLVDEDRSNRNLVKEDEFLSCYRCFERLSSEAELKIHPVESCCSSYQKDEVVKEDFDDVSLVARKTMSNCSKKHRKSASNSSQRRLLPSIDVVQKPLRASLSQLCKSMRRFLPTLPRFRAEIKNSLNHVRAAPEAAAFQALLRHLRDLSGSFKTDSLKTADSMASLTPQLQRRLFESSHATDSQKEFQRQAEPVLLCLENLASNLAKNCAKALRHLQAIPSWANLLDMPRHNSYHGRRIETKSEMISLLQLLNEVALKLGAAATGLLQSWHSDADKLCNNRLFVADNFAASVERCPGVSLELPSTKTEINTAVDASDPHVPSSFEADNSPTLYIDRQTEPEVNADIEPPKASNSCLVRLMFPTATMKPRRSIKRNMGIPIHHHPTLIYSYECCLQELVQKGKKVLFSMQFSDCKLV